MRLTRADNERNKCTTTQNKIAISSLVEVLIVFRTEIFINFRRNVDSFFVWNNLNYVGLLHLTTVIRIFEKSISSKSFHENWPLSRADFKRFRETRYCFMLDDNLLKFRGVDTRFKGWCHVKFFVLGLEHLRTQWRRLKSSHAILPG